MKRGLCVFGEVLFDHFPDGSRVLGGAPFNVAWHLQAFGGSPYFISRVGQDAEGEHVCDAMRDWGMDNAGVQTDTQLSTGRVEVTIADGEPSYDIVHPCAWDRIEVQPHSYDCELLYHGSLALRDSASQHALAALSACKPEVVFVDVNLRPPWWRHEQVIHMVRAADWVKLNGDELDVLHPADKGSIEQLRGFLDAYKLRGVVLTRGAAGAGVLTASKEYFEVMPENNIRIIDTVGAGDAFASVIILGLANDWPLDTTLQRAQAFASCIVGQRGATVTDAGFYQPFIAEWQLNN